jgi:hypothetical protein
LPATSPKGARHVQELVVDAERKPLHGTSENGGSVRRACVNPRDMASILPVRRRAGPSAGVRPLRMRISAVSPASVVPRCRPYLRDLPSAHFGLSYIDSQRSRVQPLR